MLRFLRLTPLLLVPALASASTVWKGDFETGNLSQWSKNQSVASDRLLVVSDIVREGSYALKASVRQGDNPIGASGNRNEVLYMTREAPGSEYYYKWSTLFPADYPSANSWQLFAQWHHEGCCGSPPLEFYVVGEQLNLRIGGSSGKIVWKEPLKREHWNDFIVHVKWSSDPNEGFVELYKDGQLVVPRTKVATQFNGERNYLKLGLYRDASISPPATVYHDGFVMATALEDVMPPASPPVATPDPQATPPVAAEPPLAGTLLPGDSDTPPGDLQYGQPAQGCGASSSSGAPVVAAIALFAGTLLARRRYSLVRSRARNR